MRDIIFALQGKWAWHWRVALVVVVTAVLVMGTEHSHAATLADMMH
jgi:hypothetical protein